MYLSREQQLLHLFCHCTAPQRVAFLAPLLPVAPLAPLPTGSVDLYRPGLLHNSRAQLVHLLYRHCTSPSRKFRTSSTDPILPLSSITLTKFPSAVLSWSHFSHLLRQLVIFHVTSSGRSRHLLHHLFYRTASLTTALLTPPLTTSLTPLLSSPHLSRSRFSHLL